MNNHMLIFWKALKYYQGVLLYWDRPKTVQQGKGPEKNSKSHQKKLLWTWIMTNAKNKNMQGYPSTISKSLCLVFHKIVLFFCGNFFWHHTISEQDPIFSKLATKIDDEGYIMPSINQIYPLQTFRFYTEKKLYSMSLLPIGYIIRNRLYLKLSCLNSHY